MGITCVFFLIEKDLEDKVTAKFIKLAKSNILWGFPKLNVDYFLKNNNNFYFSHKVLSQKKN